MATLRSPSPVVPRPRRATAHRLLGTAGILLALALPSPARSARIVGLLDPLEPEPRSARPGSGATEDDFRRFAERWLGRWECALREWDGGSSEPVWEARQRRTFALTLQGRFLEEAAYVLDASGWVQSGLQLSSFDAEHGRVLQSGFWSVAPGRLFAVDAILLPRRLEIDGVMTLRLDDGGIEKRRISAAFESRDRAVYRVYRQRPDGTEYLHEELVYTRLAGT